MYVMYTFEWPIGELCVQISSYPSTCASIEYGWQCFLGMRSQCHDYDANGKLTMGAGQWDFAFHLDFDDNNVIIEGQGPSLTTLRYTDGEPTWIKCRFVS